MIRISKFTLNQQTGEKGDTTSVNKSNINIGQEINGVLIDGKIGNFRQGGKGTCELLAMILGLKYQDWGREGFAEAVKPDNQGGAYVTLHDNYNIWDNEEFNKPKTYHITNEEILQAKSYNYLPNDEISKIRSDYEEGRIDSKTFEERLNKLLNANLKNRYSTGDDDVLAVELAVEKSIMNNYTNNRDMYKSIFAKCEVTDPLNSYYYQLTRLSHGLLIGDRSGQFECNISTWGQNDKKFANLLEYLEHNLDKKEITALVGFRKQANLSLSGVGQNYFTDNILYDEEILIGHAYSLKGIETDESGVKFVEFVNPHNSSDIKRLPYYIFLKNCEITVSTTSKVYDEIYEYCNNSKNDEKIDIDVLIKEEQEKLQNAFIQKNYNEFVKRLIDAPVEEKELLVKEYFNSFKVFTDPSENYKEKTLFADSMINKIEDLILTLDKQEYGWGNGEAKKALIKPLADNLNEALKVQEGDDCNKKHKEQRENSYNNILNELDALLYTDEQVIIENFKILLNKYKESITANLDE